MISAVPTQDVEKNIYDFEVKTIKGESCLLSQFRGRTLLVVNVASRCGLTPQYAGLESLYKKFHSKGFEVLGFPCNQFGGQESESEDKILEFCQTNYQVSFPMFSKINVNGREAHPLYQYLKAKAPGLMGTEAIKWNFTKFLVDKSGKVLKRFAPTTTPEELEGELVGLDPTLA